MSPNERVTAETCNAAVDCLNYGLAKIDHCLGQLSAEQVWWRPRENMNSIGNLLLHLSGNLRQWIVSGIGDVPDTRIRQAEFDHREQTPKEELRALLGGTIAEVTEVLRGISSEDLLSPKRIQGHDVTKIEALWQSVTHFQGHVQEIICLARWQLDDDYVFEWQPTTAEEGT